MPGNDDLPIRLDCYTGRHILPTPKIENDNPICAKGWIQVASRIVT